VTKNIEQRIGVTTSWMPADHDDLFSAIDKAHGAGMRALELAPAEWAGNSGYPLTRRSVGFHPDTLEPADKDRLVASCSSFDAVSIHGAGADLNVAAHNSGIRRESVRQCLGLLELAKDVGAGCVTYHPGQYLRQLLDDEILRRRNIDFGVQAAERAEKYGLVVGYEIMGFGGMGHFEHLRDVIDRIASPRFGLNLDIGHAVMLGSPPPYQWLETFAGRIVHVHVHGSFHRPDRGVETHMPLDYDDCYDLADLFGRIRAGGFDGSMILEIISSSLEKYLEYAARGKEMVCRFW